MQKKYSLQLIMSTLFIAIITVSGGTLIWQSFNKTSEIMLTSAHDLYQRINHELALDFKVDYGSLGIGIRQLRLLPLVKAESFRQRRTYLANFRALLQSGRSIASVGIAYKNGDYLALSVPNDFFHDNYSVPTGTAYVASYLKKAEDEPGFRKQSLYYIFYDKKLQELSRTSGEKTDFDPRLRSWYQQAKEVPGSTAPYLFYGSKKVGLSVMSKTSEPGVVVVLDVMLSQLSETIAKYKLTPGSEVVLINAKGRVFAYRDQDKIVASEQATTVAGEASHHMSQLQLAHLVGLDSGVLSFLSKTLQARQQHLDFDYDGRRWIGSLRLIAKPGNVDLYALMVSPVEELLADAVIIRWRLILITGLILILSIPVIWLTARKIAKPLSVLTEEAGAIAQFDFRESHPPPSIIREVDELSSTMSMMKSTINRFISLINALAGEKNLDNLIKNITRETLAVSHADAALVYLMDEEDNGLKAGFLCDRQGRDFAVGSLPDLTLAELAEISVSETSAAIADVQTCQFILNSNSHSKLRALLTLLRADELSLITLPLKNRTQESIGLLCLINREVNTSAATQKTQQQNNVAFAEALSGFAAVTLESRQLFNRQEALLHAFIKLIAGAIDAKSPYTSGHCQRVPEITFMLAQAACNSRSDLYADFNLDEDEWKELQVACWLHDCGKVTTPEYVVDKATKLETIYDRIHEVRMRFEVLKRDAEIEYWKKLAASPELAADSDKSQQAWQAFRQQCQQIDDDFAFVAGCNIGGEFMADEDLQRLHAIAGQTWWRTIDDSLGVSWEALDRKRNKDQDLPVQETVLADKAEHLIARHEVDKIPADNPWGFRVDTPENKYNRGELYNLSVRRGTLSEEERYMINAHMIQTIIMLNNLPYPKTLQNVPLIAGSHHETMDGKGYPKRLRMSEQPLTARMMVIADIFEALTASDRPYKKAKTLSESIRILSFMRDDKHIDADLFALFLTSGVYLDYGRKFLDPGQIDEVNIADYLP